MLLATALLIIGLLLVVYSADRLVYAASILCRMLGIPPLIIGMTVVSIGTSLPEIMVATAASLHGQTDLAEKIALNQRHGRERKCFEERLGCSRERCGPCNTHPNATVKQPLRYV